MEKKDLPSGERASLKSLLKSALVTVEAAFFLRRHPRVRPIIKIPKNKPIGKVYWTVESTIEPVTFSKKKHAEAFKKLVNREATVNYQAAIIRREITDRGFIPTYGEEK